MDFVGTGDIQKSVSKGDDINANTGIGVIFQRYEGLDKFFQSLELSGSINIASTSDSTVASGDSTNINNRRDYGSYILNPISSKQSIYADANVYFGETYKAKYDFIPIVFGKIISGMNVRLVASNSVWKYNDTTSHLGGLYFRAGLFHEFIPNNYRVVDAGSDDDGKSKYSIFIGAHFSHRGIIGDISNSTNEAFRTSVLGSKQRSYNGLELNFGFRLNNIRAEFQVPMLRPTSNSVEGLTDTQFIFSIKFVGGFSLKLKSEDGDD